MSAARPDTRPCRSAAAAWSFSRMTPVRRSRSVAGMRAVDGCARTELPGDAPEVRGHERLRERAPGAGMKTRMKAGPALPCGEVVEPAVAGGTALKLPATRQASSLRRHAHWAAVAIRLVVHWLNRCSEPSRISAGPSSFYHYARKLDMRTSGRPLAQGPRPKAEGHSAGFGLSALGLGLALGLRLWALGFNWPYRGPDARPEYVRRRAA